MHEGQKDYKCNSCGKLFSESGNLKRHIHTVHKGHKDYKCNSCGKLFTESGNLKRHFQSMHEEKQNNELKSESVDGLVPEIQTI